MKTKNKRMRILKVIVLSFSAIVLLLAVWQLFEYTKLKSIMLPEGTVYQVHPNLPPAAQESIRLNRSNYLTRPSDEELRQWDSLIQIPGLDKEEDGALAEEAILIRQQDVGQPDRLSLEQVEQELDFLQRYMKYGFALYAYMGGDDAFLPLFDDLKEEMIGASSDGYIATDTYIDILRRRVLWAARDRHAYVGGSNHYQVFPESQYFSYTNDTITFDLQDGTYSCLLEDQSYELLSINGVEPKDYLKSGILQDGTIAYIPWLYSDSETDTSVSCSLLLQDNTGQSFEKEIVLIRVESYTLPDDSIYSQTEEENYFYLRNSSLMSISRNMDALNQMVADAAKLDGSKPIIMDLRQHAGGNDYYAMFWLLKYMNISRIQGLNIPMPAVSYDLETRTVSSLWEGKLTNPVKTPGLVSRYKDGGGNPLHIKNDTPIFVLIDRGCGSSGEWFASYLSRLDNVVLIGENTMGVSIGGNVCAVVLPYSRYRAVFSVSISLNSDMRDLEGMGMYPDIYVPPNQAVDRVIALIEKYEIG